MTTLSVEAAQSHLDEARIAHMSAELGLQKARYAAGEASVGLSRAEKDQIRATFDNTASAMMATDNAPRPVLFEHLMIDDETLAKHTSLSLVLSVGLLPFRLLSTGPEFGEPTLVLPWLAQQLLACRMVDPETQKWWRDKCKPEASAHWADPHWKPKWKGAVHHLPLAGIGHVIDSVASEQCVPRYRVWAKGSVFDLGNLENGFVGHDGKTPYEFRDVRDHRTWILESPKLRSRPADTKAATTHDPIDDCVNQVWTLWEHALPSWFEDAAQASATTKAAA